MTARGRIVLLNGVGSAGKSTIAKALQATTAEPAAQGNNLIVDDVLLGSEKTEYAALLAPFEVFRVGVFAPLEVLEARERQRGDRSVGLARWQYDRVHKDMAYDLAVDTGSATPTECAERIKREFRL